MVFIAPVELLWEPLPGDAQVRSYSQLQPHCLKSCLGQHLQELSLILSLTANKVCLTLRFLSPFKPFYHLIPHELCRMGVSEEKSFNPAPARDKSEHLQDPGSCEGLGPTGGEKAGATSLSFS